MSPCSYYTGDSVEFVGLCASVLKRTPAGNGVVFLRVRLPNGKVQIWNCEYVTPCNAGVATAVSGAGARVLNRGLAATVVAIDPASETVEVQLDASEKTESWPTSEVQACPTGLSTEDGIPICGAETSTTAEPCRRRVPNGGGCYQHC